MTLVPFVGLHNYIVRLPADKRGPRGDPTHAHLRGAVDGDHPATRPRDGARPEPWVQGRLDLLHGPAHAVGHRVSRGRHLLALHLRHAVRDRERAAHRPGLPRGAVQLAAEHSAGRRDRARSPVMAVRAAAGRPSAGRTQDDPGHTLSGCEDGRRDDLRSLPLHHATGDQEHPDRRRHPAGDRQPAGVRPAVQPHQRRPGSRHLRPDLRDLQHLVPGPEPGLRGRGDRRAVRDHRGGERPAPGHRRPAGARPPP